MLSFKKISSWFFTWGFLLPLFFVSACGFSPLYKTSAHQTVALPMAQIQIGNIANQNGQFLRNVLLDRLYGPNTPPASPRYRLDVRALTERATSLGIQKNATATRAQLYTSATILLIDTHQDLENQVVLERNLRTLNSYNILDSQYATRVSKQSVSEMSLRDIADQTVTALSLYFKNHRGTP